MIDWIDVAVNALWILGMAILLATLSYASWEAKLNGMKLRATLARRGYQQLFTLAGMVCSFGLAGSSGYLWQKILWILLGCWFLFLFVADLIRR